MPTLLKPNVKGYGDDALAPFWRRKIEVPGEQTADDVEVSAVCLQTCLRKAKVRSGCRAGTTASVSPEFRGPRKRNRLLQQGTRSIAEQQPTRPRGTC